MAKTSDDTLKDALRQRRKHIETNLECVMRFWHPSNRLQAVMAPLCNLTSLKLLALQQPHHEVLP